MIRQLLPLFLLIVIAISAKSQTDKVWPEDPSLIPDLNVEIFSVDASHSKLNFAIGFFGFSDVEGSFNRVIGNVLYNENDPSNTSVSLVIDASSIDTGSSFRDKDLQKESFFDVEQHRMLTFKSKRVKVTGSEMELIGDLTMKGKTKEVTIPFQRTTGRFEDPFWGNLNIGFKGELTLNRMDYDIHGGRWGEKVLSEEVKIEFSLVAKRGNEFKIGQGDPSKLITQIVEEAIKNGVDSGKSKYSEITKTQALDGFYTTLIGRRLLQKDKYQQALDMFDFALEKYPNESTRIIRYQARCHAYLGNKSKALELYAKMNKRNAFDTEAWEMIKRLK